MTKFIALEPNTLMHPQLRDEAASRGYTESDGTLLIISLGAEDISGIMRALNGQCIDTLISVLTLCSIPDPQKTISALIPSLLTSSSSPGSQDGGVFLFYEHIRSGRADVQWWQSVWTPFWRLFFDGCSLDRPTHEWIQEVGGWSENSLTSPEGNSDKDMFWHVVGWFTRA